MIFVHISDQERKIDKLVWDFEDRKYARWAKENLGAEIKVKNCWYREIKSCLLW